MLKKILLASALAFVLAVPAFPATTPNSFINVQTPASATATSTTGPFTIFTAGSNGAKCNGLSISTNSTSTVNLAVLVAASTSLQATAVSVPADSGVTAGVPPVAPMSTTNWPGLPMDSEGNPYLLLPASATIAVNFSGQSSGAAVNAFISCGNF